MPIYDMLEYQMVKRNIPNGWISRLFYRTLYVVAVAFVATSIPFFGKLQLYTLPHTPTHNPLTFQVLNLRRSVRYMKMQRP